MNTCTALNERGHECMREVFPSAPLSLCQLHLLLAAQFVKEMGGRIARRVSAPAVKQTARPKQGMLQVVYYLRFGDRIKIGTTTNLRTRLQDIPHDEVLALEVGDNATERRRHTQFASARVNREWFDPTDELRDHIHALREANGHPVDAWNRWTQARHAANVLDG